MTATEVVHRYTPRGAARQLMEYRGPEILLSGPAGTGKSRACLEKGNLLALVNPRSKGLVVRKTAASLAASAVATFEAKVVPELMANGSVVYFGGSSREPAQYRYANGSTITLGGMDKATKVMSTEYDWIFVQEAIELTEEDWEALTTRLRNGAISFQQLMADTNPAYPTHWLKQRAERAETLLLESRHEDNPLYFDPWGRLTPEGEAYIGGILDRLTGPRYLRLRRGLWVAAEGVIFEEFDPAVHVIDRFPIPESWQRFWVVDFGYVHPFVLQRWAIDHDGRAYLYREIHHTRRLVEDHARDVLLDVTARGRGQPSREEDRATALGILAAVAAGRRRWIEPRPVAVICDHDAEDRATLERHLQLITDPANKAVTSGLEAVMSRLRPAGDGRPRVFILRDAVQEVDQDRADAKLPTCTADEVGGYVWADGGKEQPRKDNDDGCDAMRYLVARMDLDGYGPRLLGAL